LRYHSYLLSDVAAASTTNMACPRFPAYAPVCSCAGYTERQQCMGRGGKLTGAGEAHDSPGNDAQGADVERAGGGRERLREALEELQRAVRSRKVDTIVAAYQGLHDSANGIRSKGVLELAMHALGPEARDAIVSAYSHRRCFMCTRGQAPCDRCAGSGMDEDGDPCAHCRGAGMAPCDFCRGTGWADQETTPPEIRDIVVQRRLSQVNEDLARLARAVKAVGTRDLRRLPEAQLRELTVWLEQMQARLLELCNLKSVTEKQTRQLEDASARVSSLRKLTTGE